MSKLKKKTDPAETLPAKAQLILDSDSDSESDSNNYEFHSAAEAEAQGKGFKINAEYAKRFEHNKKREELQKCTLPHYPPRKVPQASLI